MSDCYISIMKIINRALISAGLYTTLYATLSMPVPAWSQSIPHLGSAADKLWSKSEELSLGKATYDRLSRQGHILQDQANQDYLNYLGNKIGTYAHTRTGLTFYLTNARPINAFATPGGYIGINAGLVLATENEHELAGVIAHEIAHVSQEHIARSVLAAQDRRIGNMAALAAGVLLATQNKNDNVGSSVISGVIANETQQQINDIRQHEIEADKTGRQLMEKAGFSERGMQSFFGKLRQPINADAMPAYLLTHPLPLDRQAAIDNPHRSKKTLRSSDEYYLFRARVRAAVLSQKRLTTLINSESKGHTAQIRDAARYLDAMNNITYGRFHVALKKLSTMTTGMKNKRDVQLLRAKLYLLSNQSQKAQNTYQKLWKRYRGDSVVAYDYASFLSNKGRIKQAAELLSRQLDSDTLNPQLYLLYGQLLDKRGEMVKKNRLLIRYYQQSGQYQRALAQVQVALTNPRLDWQTKSMFEAKQKELQRIIDQAVF